MRYYVVAASAVAVSLFTLPLASTIGATPTEPKDISTQEARRLLNDFYRLETTSARAGDIKTSVSPFTELTEITFNTHKYVGRSEFEALYPAGYKDETYRIESLSAVIKGDEIYNFALVHGKTPGPGKAYMMIYHFRKIDGRLVLLDLVSSTVNKSAIIR